MQGQNDPAYGAIIKSISAIVFLSTPHRGTNLAETLNRILQVSFSSSPMQFISELSAGSQTLQKLNEQFRHVAPKLDIISFYETRPTPLAVFKKSQIVSIRAITPLICVEQFLITHNYVLDGPREGLISPGLPGGDFQTAGCRPPWGVQIRQPVRPTLCHGEKCLENFDWERQVKRLVIIPPTALEL